MDFPILLIKNWFDNPTIVFEAKRGPQYVDGFWWGSRKHTRCDKCEFPNEIEDHVKDCVGSWHMYSLF